MKTILLLIFMAVTADKFVEVADGDQAFYRVDTRRPPQELEPGVAADAVNCRFEDGRAWPRYGVNQQAWGASGLPGLIPPNATMSFFYGVYGKLVVGQRYALTVQSVPSGPSQFEVQCGANNNGNGLINPVRLPLPVSGVPLIFTANGDSLVITDATKGSGQRVGASLVPFRNCRVLGCARFEDPEGFDSQVVLSDDWRDQPGEDGGRGRVWRILPGNVPLSVPLNGHDLWDTARTIPCFNGLILLRQGNERHYFCGSRTLAVTDSSASGDTLSVDTTTLVTGQAVVAFPVIGTSGIFYARVSVAGKISLYDTVAHANAGGGTGLYNVTSDGLTGVLTVPTVDSNSSGIQLNAVQDWVNGDRVIFYADNTVAGGSYFSGTTPPQNATAYFVKVLAGNVIELFSDQGLGTKLVFTSASGRFWIERAADFPGFYGNAAPPLLAQPDGLGRTIWQVGFLGVPVTVVVTTTDASTNLVTAPNHRLLPGDHVNVTGLQTTGPVSITAAYVYPVSDHVVRFYSTLAGALAQDPSVVVAQIGGQSGTITKAGASGLPCPGGREGAYYQNRLLVVNGRDTLAISDALDPLHFTPFEAAVTANLGESSQIMALWPLGTNDAVLVLRENEVELLSNFSGGPSAWTLTSLTREYGCIAPLSVAQVGADVWFLSRKGVASITQTQNGVLQGVADPVSKAMKKYLDMVDWRHADQACGGYWNNRYFLAVPLKGQSGSGSATGNLPQNNGVLSHNFLNQGMTRGAQDGVFHFETIFGWEGLWSGASLQPVVFARLKVFGDERICFVNAAGQVCWLGDGFIDQAPNGLSGPGTAIAATLTTRRYTGGNQGRKLWLSGLVTLDTYAPNLTISAVFPGVNDAQALVANKTYDARAYGIAGLVNYNPATATPQSFAAPFRQDYEISAGELLAGAPDTHQNHPVPVRMRRLQWGVQLQIANIAGSMRVAGVQVGGVQRDLVQADPA